MESTVLNTFSRRANLLTLLSSDNCPPILKESWNQMHPHLNISDLDIPFNPPTHGHNCQKASNRKAVYDELDIDIEESLRSYLHEHLSVHDLLTLNTKHVHKLRRCHVNNILYMPSYASVAHSLVYIRESSTQTLLVPVEIREIFEHSRIQDGRVVMENFAAVHYFREKELTGRDDPFRDFPDFRAALYYRVPGDKVAVIRVDQIDCHANQRPWDEETVVMRGINRVSGYYLIIILH